jgi:putative FmdB family regulatory protein
MPIYEYRCKNCDQRFEAIRPINDRARNVTCPECGRSAAERLPSTFAATGACGPAAGGFT